MNHFAPWMDFYGMVATSFVHSHTHPPLTSAHTGAFVSRLCCIVTEPCQRTRTAQMSLASVNHEVIVKEQKARDQLNLRQS